MNIYTHFLFPFFIATILVKLNVISWKLAFVCGLVGMLVDVDHYVEHVAHSKTNRFSLKAAWNNSIKFHRFNQRSFVHYWSGALVLTVIFAVVLYFSWKISLILAVGYYSHLMLDYVHLKKDKFLRWKLFKKIYMKESNFEFILDMVLVIGILIVWA